MPLLPTFTGPSVLTCAEPFETVDDLAGRQVRVGGGLQQSEYEALGVSGVFMPVLEQYEALQRGVLDCAVNGVLFVEDLLEVAPYVAIPSTAVATTTWVISTDAWSQFSPEVQQVLLDLRLEHVANYNKAALDDYAKIPAGVEAAGGELVDSTEFDQLIADWWADQPSLELSAPSAIQDPAAVLNEVKENAAWWQANSTEELGVQTSGNILETLKRGSDLVDWTAWTDTVRSRIAETEN